MPGNPTRKGLRDCCAAEVMNELAVGTPNPRELKEPARRTFDTADAMLGGPAGRSLNRRAAPGLAWTHGSGLAPGAPKLRLEQNVPLSRGNRGRKQGIFRSHGDDHKQ